MIARSIFRTWLVVLSLSVGWQVLAADSTTAGANTNSESAKPLRPGPTDGRIAFVTAKMLEKLHYTREPFGDKVSERFLEKYLEALDPQHLHFFQADLSEFDRYRTRLDNLTLAGSGVADVRPAYEIYNRFMKRLEQRAAYAEELLKAETFKFDTNDKILINRKDEPYPKDLDEARQLWKERLRFEYLQERLGKIDARQKAEKDAKAGKKPAEGEEKKAPKKSESEEIVDTLSHRYQRTLKMFRDWDSDDVIQYYLTTLARVYDPHSDYFGHDQLEQFKIGMNLSLFGIGAELKSEDGYCTINRLLPGGPATKSKKIKEKDRIVAVAQSNQPPVDVVDMNLNKAVQLIRGPKGTEVRLTIIPADADMSVRKEVTLIRDEIPLDDMAAKGKIIDLPGTDGTTTRMGVIDLPSFYATFDTSGTRSRSENKSTTADVIKLVNKLKQENIKGLILDLRRNGGGSLEEAIRLTGLFIKEGPVVQIKSFDGDLQEDSDNDPSVLYDGPLVVLTSRFSASASEIVAGALQDYGRAVVIGDIATHGKGTVQSVNPLNPYVQFSDKSLTNDPGALKLTIKKFYRASGASTQRWGVTPDIVLPSVLNESKDFGEDSLDYALPYDTLPGSKFEPLNRVAPYLEELRRRSNERIASDKDFEYIREDIEHYKKVQADKTISLNEQTRLKEKDEADARQKAREQERLARKETSEKVYEITLKNVSLPGLPPPVAKTNNLAKVIIQGSVGTNESASAGSAVPAKPNEAGEDEDKAPAVDATMNEAQHILVDYLELLSKRGQVAGNLKLP